jgi:FkbM family methyltransferase
MQLKLRSIVKVAVSAALWNTLRNKYNRLRYQLLWQRRKVVSFEKDGKSISLVINDPKDGIQNIQSAGQFYEENELAAISPFFKPGQIFVDIGANTGQHSIYFLRILGASKAILFEPLPETCRILRENIRLNNLNHLCDLTHLGLGLSDRNSNVNFSVDLTNLGRASLQDNMNGPIRTVSGDSVLEGQHVDFIKIDTEGFEMKVLKGLEKTIEKSRPILFIEVDNDNYNEFAEFMNASDYEVAWRYREYAANENFLLKPKVQK